VAADFIIANIVTSNAFSVFLLGVNCGSTYLAENAQQFIVKTIETYDSKVRSLMDDLLQLDIRNLETLLEEICDNYIAFMIICGWILYDVSNRSNLLDNLITNFINVELISPDAILVDGLEDLLGKTLVLN